MARQALIVLGVVIAFGILVPVLKGFGILDPRIILAYACLALLFVAPASAELGGVGVSSLLGRIGLLVAWAWGIAILILGTALVTLNAMNRRGGFIMPPPAFLASVLAFSLSGSIAVAMLGAVLARRFPAGGVKTILRTGFLAILLLVFGARFLPEKVTLAVLDRLSTRRALTHLAWEAAAFCAAAAALLLLALFRTRLEAPFAKIPMAENPGEGGR
jgi:hypothetical protein